MKTLLTAVWTIYWMQSASDQSRRHGRALVGLAPQHSSNSPKFKYETLHISGVLPNFAGQVPVHKSKAPLMTIFWRRFCIRHRITEATISVPVIGLCSVCSRNSAKPGQKLMTELPPPRLQVLFPPFYHVGIDYFGPLQVRQRLSNMKRYGCLYTCTSTTTHEVSLDTAMNL